MAFLTAKEAKLYGLIVAGATLLALVGTLIFILVTREPTAKSEPAPKIADSPAGVDLLGDSASRESLLQKIRIPEEYTQLYQQEWHPYREVHSRWSEEQIDSFWIDPQDLIEEVLQKKSDREVEEFFKEIP